MIGATAVEAPWGPIRLAADEDAVVALEVLSTPDSFGAGCLRRLGEWPQSGPALPVAVRRRLEQGVEAVTALLEGEPVGVARVPISLHAATDWDRLILGGVRELAWGETIGYGALAERVGRRGAARAAGGAVGRNPIGLLIPCHRVIAGDGTLGGYGGGWFGEREALLEIKVELLAREGNHPPRRPSMSVLAAYRRLLHNRPLMRLLGGEFVSSIGDWLYLVALLVLVYQASSDPVLLGIVGAARVLPYVLLSYVAGVVADRFDRRLVLLVTDLARGTIMLAMAALQLVHGPLAAIIGLAILATCFSTFFAPTIGSYLPNLVSDETELGPANSAWSSLDNLAFVVGPAIAGILIAIGGLTAAFVLNAASFGVIAIVLWRLPQATPVEAPGTADPGSGATADRPPAGAAPSGSGQPSAAQSSAGSGPTLPIRPLAGLALIDIGSGFAIGGIGILTVVLATRQLGAGDDGTGYLNAAIGVGGLLGAVGSGLVVIRSRLSLPLVAGLILFGLGLVGLGWSSTLAVGFVMLAIVSAGSLLVEVVSTTLVQRIVPAGARGRAIGSIQTVATLAYAAGAFALPILADRLGVGPVLAGTALLVVAGGLVGVALVGVAGSEGPDPELAAVARRVAGLPLFAGIPAFRVAATLARGTTTEVAPGEAIIRQGDVADRFYVILSGTVEVSQAEQPGQAARHLRRMGADEVFGELGLLTGAPRSATVTAETPVRLLALDAPAFLDLVTAGPELAPRLLALHRGAPAGS